MFDDRLKKLRIARNLTQKDAADALKLKTNTYRNYENDEREPTAMTLLSIARFFGVTVDYLLNYKVTEQVDTASAAPNAPELSPESREVLEMYRELTPEQQEYIKITMQGLLAANDKKAIEKKKDV